ncbi:histone H1 [Bacteroidia bacterium]|nr:histone H1 [Bacteroidia bacterium]
MKNLVENLKEHFEAFTKDAADHVEKGNKAAGTRARKTSLAIEKSLKDFRKKSIETSKK